MLNLKLFTAPDPVSFKPCMFVQAEGFEPYRVVELELQKEAAEFDMTEMLKAAVSLRLDEYNAMCTGFIEERDRLMGEIFK